MGGLNFWTATMIGHTWKGDIWKSFDHKKNAFLSIVAPKQIREQGLVYKIIKLVESGENLHCKLNKLERQYTNVTNKSERMFCMIKEYENSLYMK